MVNICKLSINVVNDNKPKMLIGLAKKASGLVRGLYAPLSLDADTAPPADRQDLNDPRRSDAFVQGATCITAGFSRTSMGKMRNAVSP